jgi:hypothetical protein
MNNKRKMKKKRGGLREGVGGKGGEMTQTYAHMNKIKIKKKKKKKKGWLLVNSQLFKCTVTTDDSFLELEDRLLLLSITSSNFNTHRQEQLLQLLA